MMRAAVAVAVAVLLSLQAVPASARRIVVVPGVGTPLQDGINAAGPGDTVRVGPGTYSEAIVINKPLKVYGKEAVIDAGCGQQTAVLIAADAVTLRGVEVRGGTFYGIDTTSRDLVVIDRVKVVPTCVGVEYGINVFQASRMRIRGNTIDDVTGFGDAGIYVGGTPPDADVRIERNFLRAPSDRGIIVEDTIDSPGRPVNVRVRKNEIIGAGVGIYVFGSGGVEVLSNRVSGGTAAGIEITINSNDNLLIGNRLEGNNPDVLDNGTGNCWRSTSYTSGMLPPPC